MVWQAVVERFEQQAPASVMARLALEQALPAGWMDEVFEAHRQRQYPRELLFSTVMELMTLVALGLRPSLHAAARQWGERLPVSLAALYEKVNHCEPAVLRALVQGSAQRLRPLTACLPGPASVPGWQLRVLDGNHLPASEKRLAALRDFRGAALPGHALVVYDPDQALVCDLVACEDAHESERVGAACLIASAGRATRLASRPGGASSSNWRPPTEAGDTHIALWSNLPEAITAAAIARLYRQRWRIEDMFQRLESVLHSEIRSLGHPRAALLGFTAAVLAYNVLALLKRVIEQAHHAALAAAGGASQAPATGQQQTRPQTQVTPAMSG